MRWHEACSRLPQSLKDALLRYQLETKLNMARSSFLSESLCAKHSKTSPEGFWVGFPQLRTLARHFLELTHRAKDAFSCCVHPIDA